MYSLEPQSSFTWGHDGNAGAGATLLARRPNLEEFNKLLGERPYSKELVLIYGCTLAFSKLGEYELLFGS